MELLKPELASQIAIVVIGLNAGLWALYSFLGAIKDQTKSPFDDKAYTVIGKIAEVLQKIIGILGMAPKK